MKPTGYTSGFTFLTLTFAFITGKESPLNQKCYLSKTLTYATDMVYFGVHFFTTCIYNMSLSIEVTCGEI